MGRGHKSRIASSSIILFALLSVLLMSVSTDSFAVDASESINETVNQILPKLKNSKELNKNFIEPILTDSSLSTLDNSKTGPAKIICPGTKTILQLLIQPSATKDLQYVHISYDTDYDGKLDKVLTLNIPISGVCANGFVSCLPGTWKSCKWFAWKYTGVLTYEEVSPTKLGGCYCINVGCTQASFIVMKDRILRDLGGGIAGAMFAGNYQLAVAEAEIEDFIIRFYGQSSSKCGLTDATLGNLYGDNAAFESRKSQELAVAEQMSDPNSYYNLVTKSPAFVNADSQLCIMTRSVYFDNNSCQLIDETNNGCILLENNKNCSLKEEKIYDAKGNVVYTYANFNPTGVLPLETCKQIQMEPTCSFEVPVSGSTCTGYVEGPTKCGNSCAQIKGFARADGGSATLNVYLTAEQINSLQQIYLSWCTDTYSTGNCFDDDGGVKLIVNNQQVVYQTYHNCEPCNFSKPVPKNVFHVGNNVIYFVNWAGKKPGTGCRPFVISFLFQDQGVYKEVCHQWWKVERTYLCKSETSQNPDLTRADVVIETLSNSGTTWSYSDPAFSTFSFQLNMNDQENCIEACKLTIAEERAQATASATTSDYRYDPSTKIFIYRTCIQGRCPVSEGEIIVQDCTCLKEFGLAYGVLESLRQSSIDMTCSSGARK